MPTVDPRFINTDSTAGGDGTSDATSGANRAWATMQEARTQLNAAYGSGLVAADVQVDLQCRAPSGVADTTAISAAWPTSDATRYIHMFVPVAERKVAWDDNVYTIRNSAINGIVFDAATHTMEIVGLQFQHDNNLNLLGNTGIVKSTGSGGRLVLDGPKVRRGPGQIGGGGIIINALAGTYVLRNVLVAGFEANVLFLNMPDNSTVLLYNPTIVGDGSAGGYAAKVLFTAGGSGKVARVKNALMQQTASGLTITNATTSDTATNQHNTGIAASFIDAANINFRLTAADTVARNLGTDLSLVADWPFDWDGDLTTRPVGSAWDIGAHEQTTPNAGSGYAFIL